MRDYHFTFNETQLVATATGALWIAEQRTLCVSDLHLGKANRIVRRSGAMLPPYDTNDTLLRLEKDIAHYAPRTVICLGDSFDDLMAAQELTSEAKSTIATLQSGRNWIWVEGNHDPKPLAFSGQYRETITTAGLQFRHIATSETAQVSGHYHPKHGIRGCGSARACFLYDKNRLILPAYGTYTGGLSAQSLTLREIFPNGAIAILTGEIAIAVPVLALAMKKGSF